MERYLDRLVAHDWEAMAACLAEDVVRVGPFGDTYTPRDPYVAFLPSSCPRSPATPCGSTGSSTRAARWSSSSPRSSTSEAHRSRRPRSLVFDLDAEDRIAHIAIYIQRLGEVPALP